MGTKFRRYIYYNYIFLKNTYWGEGVIYISFQLKWTRKLSGSISLFSNMETETERLNCPWSINFGIKRHRSSDSLSSTFSQTFQMYFPLALVKNANLLYKCTFLIFLREQNSTIVGPLIFLAYFKTWSKVILKTVTQKDTHFKCSNGLG